MAIGDQASPLMPQSFPLRSEVLAVPRVGARLQQFARFWREGPFASSIQNVVCSGLQLVFRGDPPPLTTAPYSIKTPRDQKKAAALFSAVADLLQKGAIQEADPHSPGFYNHLFLVQKSSGDQRPVLDLSRLNKFLKIPKFRMESNRTVRKSIRPGDWAILIDLKDAYLHIPIHQEFRRYLRFCLEGKVYQFVALPFGLSTAPWAFTRVVCEFIMPLRREGIRMNLYLDDWLAKNQCKDLLLIQTEKIISWIARAGFLINWQKSSLTPSQDFVYLGTRFRTDLGISLPPQDKISKLVALVGVFAACRQAKAVQILSLLGSLNAVSDHVPWGRLHLRPLQLCLLSQWRPNVDPLHKVVRLPHLPLLPSWEFWGNPQNLSRGVSLLEPKAEVTLFTDASLIGWGAHLDSQHLAKGVWSEALSQEHINNLELRAVLLAVQAFLPLLRGRVVCLMADNMTAVQYIKNQGGTRSLTLFRISWDLLQVCRENNITLLPQHLSGVSNTLADALSRTVPGRLPMSEWSLNRQVFHSLWAFWDKPAIDLFANHLNSQLTTYFSPFPDPRALGVDALKQSWDLVYAYAFPPFALIQSVLSKIRHSRCTVILIAPNWPSRPWFPDLLELLVDYPVVLPVSQSLLVNQAAHLYYQYPEWMQLHAWKLSSCVSLREDFLKAARKGSPSLRGIPQAPFIPADGTNLLVGVIRGILIHSRLMQ